MTRGELFTLAAALPIGALALVPEKPPEDKLPEPPGPMVRDPEVKWMVIHAGDGNTLPSHHPYGKGCGKCAGSGVPSPIWYTGK